ncbi:hypothetical protein [Aestuariivirga sp.]|uniref:hypothetical protein n=1 Tax=Aestuariivirga sp. TaxID=2650926 RepID=UPI0037831ABC
MSTGFGVFSSFTLQFAVVAITYLFGCPLPRGKQLAANTLLVMDDFKATPFSRLLSDFECRAGQTRLTILPS